MFTHILGRYKKEHGKIIEEPLTREERESLHTTSYDANELEEYLPHITPDAQLLREANIVLTKRQLRESVTPDLLIVNTINTIEEIDKVTNTLAKRLREWYALYDPEFEHAYKDHRAFLEGILTRTSERASDTMGADFAEQDIKVILEQAHAAHALYKQRDHLLAYLEIVTQQHIPNIRAVAGAMIGGKLLAIAGSLERLSRMPSGTIQLLGAETALFRHLRNKKARPPKHGIIFNHLLLQRAPKQLHGKIARVIADKVTIAAKVDFFKGEFIGEKLHGEIEAKLREI